MGVFGSIVPATIAWAICGVGGAWTIRSGWNQCSTVVAMLPWITSVSIMKIMNRLSGTISPFGPRRDTAGIVTVGGVDTTDM